MSTVTTEHTATAPLPFEVPGPIACVPSLEEIERLTAIAERRVVYRGVDWSFYEQLVDSIPERSRIHVDYDGKDLEVISKSGDHEDINDALGYFVKIVAEEALHPLQELARTDMEASRARRGIEADQCYYFRAEKMMTYARVARPERHLALAEPGSGDRGRHLASADRSRRHLCSARGSRSLAVRRETVCDRRIDARGEVRRGRV